MYYYILFSLFFFSKFFPPQSSEALRGSKGHVAEVRGKSQLSSDSYYIVVKRRVSLIRVKQIYVR